MFASLKYATDTPKAARTARSKRTPFTRTKGRRKSAVSGSQIHGEFTLRPNAPG